MFGLGIPEIIVIVVVFGILFFGSGRITEFAKSLGRFTGEFKKGKAEINNELRKLSEDTDEEDKENKAK